jgi:cyanophycinase
VRNKIPEPDIILREVARRVGRRKLVITTVASREPEGTFEEYQNIFRDFGVQCVDLEISARGDALEPDNIELMNVAMAVFFTGGDQLKITSQIGDTPIFSRLREIYHQGGLVAGTSVGASVVCETMLIGGPGEESHRSDHNLRMAPGLGFFKDAIVDQHFAERGRFGRLLGAVARNPRNLGVGIDEDTAVVVENGESFYVIGSGAVYVLDGRNAATATSAKKRTMTRCRYFASSPTCSRRAMVFTSRAESRKRDCANISKRP